MCRTIALVWVEQNCLLGCLLCGDDCAPSTLAHGVSHFGACTCVVLVSCNLALLPSSHDIFPFDVLMIVLYGASSPWFRHICLLGLNTLGVIPYFFGLIRYVSICALFLASSMPLRFRWIQIFFRYSPLIFH